MQNVRDLYIRESWDGLWGEAAWVGQSKEGSEDMYV